MAAKKSISGKGGYAAYKSENRVAKNKARKLARHLKNHPNDKQTEQALSRASSYKPRTAPKRTTSRVGMRVNQFYVKKGAEFKQVTAPRTINTADGRISTSGKFQQQMIRMIRKLNNAYQFLQKSRKQIIGDEIVAGYVAPVEVENSSKPSQPKRRKRSKPKPKS